MNYNEPIVDTKQLMKYNEPTVDTKQFNSI